MITEDFVSYETAKLLKEKGFNEPFYFFYRTDDRMIHHVVKAKPLVYDNNIDDEVISAPTLQMAMKWLREVHEVFLEISVVGMDWGNPTEWHFGWRAQTKELIDRKRAEFSSYEVAANEAIKYSLVKLI